MIVWIAIGVLFVLLLLAWFSMLHIGDLGERTAQRVTALEHKDNPPFPLCDECGAPRIEHDPSCSQYIHHEE